MVAIGAQIGIVLFVFWLFYATYLMFKWSEREHEVRLKKLSNEMTRDEVKKKLEEFDARLNMTNMGKGRIR